MGESGMHRRGFIKTVGACAAAAGALSGLSRAGSKGSGGSAGRQLEEIRRPLRVKPALVNHIPQRRKEISWRGWGGLQSESDVNEELARIDRELKKLASGTDFPVEMQSVARVNSDSKVKKLQNADADALLVYAAGGPTGWYDRLQDSDKRMVWFLRHQSGPVYLWYEIFHPRFLRHNSDTVAWDDANVWDAVVDNYDDLEWRLRALCGEVNTAETTIVALGGAGGWGQGGEYGPENAKKIWGIDIKSVPHEKLTAEMERVRGDEAMMKKLKKQAKDYVKGAGVESVDTRDEFIQINFVQQRAMRNLMDRHDACALTVLGCMGYGRTAGSPPCLAFSLINDAGPMAFCESDFAVIPAGILLRHICGKPVMLHNPTLPHDGIMTGAHCTAPRRMSGGKLDPVKLVTHFESDWGAAPKVQFPRGQKVTSLVPSFTSDRWLGVRSTIVGHPFMPICRSQMEMELEGDWVALREQMRGFHWMSCYGDYLREVGYVLSKKSPEWKAFVDVT